MTDTLEAHLSSFYTEHILRGKPQSVSVQSMKDAFTIDRNLGVQAQRRLDELCKLDASTGGNLANRCYVSHVQKKALEEALR